VWTKNRSSSEGAAQDLPERAVFTVDSGRSFRAQAQGGDEYLGGNGIVAPLKEAGAGRTRLAQTEPAESAEPAGPTRGMELRIPKKTSRDRRILVVSPRIFE
jgi:hypothetical protein